MPQCHFDRIERDTYSDLQHWTNQPTRRHNKRLRAVHWDGSQGSFGIGNGNQKAQIRNGYSGTTRKLKLDTIQRALNHGQISISITNLQRLWRADCIQTTPLVAALRMLQILWQTAGQSLPPKLRRVNEFSRSLYGRDHVSDDTATTGKFTQAAFLSVTSVHGTVHHCWRINNYHYQMNPEVRVV